MARWLVISAVALIASASSIAHAEDVPRAEQLFQEARTLAEAGRYAEACPKLAESQELEPAVGTQFNLADCYEHVGRTASAYLIFRDVARIARAAGKFEREKSARERAAALERQLPRLRVQVEAPAPGQELRVDGAPVTPTSIPPEGQPLDPGAHRVSASAPGRTAWTTEVTARAGEAVDVRVPALVDPTPATPEAAPSRSTGKTAAFALAGVAVVGLGVGAVSGAIALGRRDDAEETCPKELHAFRCPTAEGADAWNGARTAGNVSTVAFVIGGAALASAAVLWLTAPSSRARIAATLSGVRLEGSF